MTVERPLRADARRNRARLLDAAEAVFAAKGTWASTEEVARTAGVGVGTLFRHFPTKENLLEAVYRERLRRMADAAREVGAASDLATAFFGFLADQVAHSGTKIAVADALAEAGIDVSTTSAVEGREVSAALGDLLVRAQKAGAVRPDVGLPELMALLVGASRAVEHAASDEVRARIVRIILDGLRPATASPDPGQGRRRSR
jgi:AcrR family transcriptional regulator